MKHVKSERLKRLESELIDLEQWLKLGLVPKKDIAKHQEEIKLVHKKIQEEKDRLQTLRDSGELDEALIGKKATNPRQGVYSDMPTAPEIDLAEAATEVEGATDLETETGTFSGVEEKEGEEGEELEEEEEEEEESYFSDRNRWKRGGIVDPEANDW